MNNKIYKDMNEWYHPEIDYYAMIRKLRWTKNHMSHFLKEPMPLKMCLMMSHSNAWEMREGKERAGNQQMFQFWNKQFNDGLAEIIKKWEPKLILDVCAGDGQLANILTKRNLPVKAVDDYSWGFDKRYFNVEKMDYKEALAKYQPDVVIGCWMELYTNWTPDFRKTKSVKHYMIIGEVEACCGGEWKERKGWRMTNYGSLNKTALCRTDDIWWGDSERNQPEPLMDRRHSQVYTFDRL